jgi:hypothetical protein
MRYIRWRWSPTRSTWYARSDVSRGPVLTDLQLNDVISLLVGLWAVKVANEKSNSKTYTYGVSNLVAVSRMAD